MPSHLPLLLNPLLNAIFNNPQPAKSPLNELYSKLDKSWNDGTVILVPPLEMLLHYKDKETGTPYYELSYSEEFINDHIITTKELSNSKIFTTFSSKEVLIKKDLLFTGKNFKKSLRLKVFNYDYFQSFNDYFEKGRKFLIMYIEAPMVGTPVESNKFEIMAPSSNNTERVALPEVTLAQSQQTNGSESPAMSYLENSDESFEQIIRKFPLIAKSVGEKYKQAFKAFNVRDLIDTDSLIQTFTQTSELSSHIFQTLSPDLVDLLFQQYPGLDLNKCIHNYVELNLYDKIWNSLCSLKKDFLADEYSELQNFSINQASLPGDIKTNISIQTILEKHVNKAINIFKKLSLTTNTTSKIDIFVSTISVLSNIEELTIDADILVGLLLLVVVHSGVPHLESHLFYVQNFAFENIDLGLTGYSLSTVEALLYFLKNEENLQTLKSYSHLNKKLFSHINTKDLLGLKKIADDFDGNAESALKSRTLNGESILMSAIQSNDYDTWKLLIDYEELFPLEDILDDRTINDTNLFNVALNSENTEMIDDLTEILLSSCTLEELKRYFNTPDKYQRTIGHYLFHYQDVIPKIGPFIDWTAKDLNGQTPLFAICRSYDNPNYAELIAVVFEVIDKWYSMNNSEFDYTDHIDNRGNTLLHILNSNIETLLRYPILNVNESNERSYTPLMIYVKYNRIDNIKRLLQSEALDIKKVDRNYFSCVDQCKNNEISDLIHSFYLKDIINPVNNKAIGIVRVKLDNNNWRLVVRGRFQGDPHEFEALHTFIDLKTLIEIIKTESPNNYLPIAYILGKFDLVLNLTGSNKLKLNKLVDLLNLVLQSILLEKSFEKNLKLWAFLKDPTANPLGTVRDANLRMVDYKIRLLNHTENGDATKEIETFFLQPEEISEINFFAKFCLKEVNKWRQQYDILFKIVNFQSLKSRELNEAYELFGMKQGNLTELQFLSDTLEDLTKEFQLDSNLCDGVLFLSLSADEFMSKISSLINKKIYRWWKLYGQLIELNNNYKKFKFVELKKNNNNEEGEIQGLLDLNEESFQDLTRSANFEASDKDSSKPVKNQKPGFFLGFIESKRQKYETRLLEGIRSVKHDLYELNKDIKFNHEMIAMEMNNFMVFKTDFLIILLKRYVQKQIRDWKFKNMMLRRSLENIRRVK